MRVIGRLSIVVIMAAVAPVIASAACIPFFDESDCGVQKSKVREVVEENKNDEEEGNLLDVFVSNNLALSESIVTSIERDGALSLDEKIFKAWILFKKNRYDDALELFEEIGKETNLKLDRYLGPAWVAVKQGRYEDAEEWIKKAKSKAQNHEKFLVSDISGWLALNQGDLVGAKRHFGQVKKDIQSERINYIAQISRSSYVLPDDIKNNWEATPFISMGWWYIFSDDWGNAEKSFSKCYDKNKKGYMCLDGLARVAMNHERYDEALDYIVDGIQITGGGDPGLNGLLGTVLYYISDPEKNEEVYRDLASRYPDELVYRTGLGYTYLVNDKYEKASAAYKKGLRLNSDCYGCRDGLARVHLDQGEYEKALDQALKGIEILEGRYSGLNGLLDLTLSYISDPEKSESTYNGLVLSYPNEPVYLSGLGNTQVLIGKRQEGKDNLARFIVKWEQIPQAQDVRYDLAWLLYFDKQNQESLQILSDYFDYGGVSVDALRVMSFSQFRMNDYENAKKNLEYIADNYYSFSLIPITEQLDVYGSDRSQYVTYNVLSTLGWVNYNLGDMEGARSVFSGLLNKSPDWVDVLVGLGYVEMAEGNKSESEGLFERALDIYPDYPDALYGLSLLREK